MHEYCCDSLKIAVELGLVEHIKCPVAEFALKNERVFMFIRACPFCKTELEEK